MREIRYMKDKGTIASELVIVSDADKEIAFQQEYRSTIESISLNTMTFIHPNLAYQILAG